MKNRHANGKFGWRKSRVPCAGESGQALVETIVSLGVLVVFMLGVIELGQIAFTAIQVANAAKAAVQYGTQNGATAQDQAGIATAAAADAPSLSGLSNTTFTSTSSGTTSSYACICSDGSSSTCANTDCSTSHIIETVTVNTQYVMTPVLHLPVLGSTITLKGHAAQQCAQ
jgi:Flp pilus assembly protein TadG